MKRLAKVLTLALAVSAVLFTAVAPAKAAAYTYTVTVIGGEHGAASNSTTISGLSYGKRLRLNTPVSDDDSYYAKGYAIAGTDTVVSNSFTVTGDTDLVVLYGAKSNNMVGYTVNYIDADGNKLLDSDTFEGAVGDKPVIAYKYVEGYTPRDAYALTKTLSANAADNVFNFVYVKGTDGTYVINGTYTVITRETVVPGETTTTTTATQGEATVNGAGAEAGTEEAVEGETEEPTIEEEATPEEVVDLDEEDIPLADSDLDSSSGVSAPVVGGICAGAAALAAIVVLLVRRKKKQA